MKLIFRIEIFSIMIKSVLAAKRNRLKGGKLTSSERMKRYSLIDFVTKSGKQPWGEGGDFFWLRNLSLI